jgi:hypothetical protein
MRLPSRKAEDFIESLLIFRTASGRSQQSAAEGEKTEKRQVCAAAKGAVAQHAGRYSRSVSGKANSLIHGHPLVLPCCLVKSF